MNESSCSGLQDLAVIVGDQSRSLLVYQPVNVEMNLVPVILAFHGAGSCAAEMARFTNLTACADRCGFMVAFPNGSGRVPNSRSWNAGPANIYAVRHQVDDIAFVHAAIDVLTSAFPIDPTRVYAAGMSNGGLLAYLLAAKMPHRLASVAAVGCSFLSGHIPQPAAPIPILHFHGTDDRFVPYDGGIGSHSFTRSRFVPVQQAIEFWATSNRCRFPPREFELEAPPTPTDEETRVQIRVYENDENGAEVRMITIRGGGHTWPGQTSPYAYLGRSTTLIDANQLIWDFHRRFRIK